MSRMIPKDIPSSCKSDAEKKIFRLLRDAEGTEDWIVLYSVILSHHPSKIIGEADFLVLAPGLGFFAMEVKGGGISRSENGQWEFTNRQNVVTTKNESPFSQAKGEIFSIVDFIQDHVTPNSGISKCLFGFCVAFPNIDFETERLGPEADEAMVLDRSKLFDIRGFFEKLADYWRKRPGGQRKLAPTVQQVKEAAKAIRGEFDFTPLIGDMVNKSENQLSRLTEEEYEAIDQMEENPRVVYKGAAGTGKTLVALELARRSNAKNIGFLCFNKNLSSWLSKKIESADIGNKVSKVSNIHSLMLSVIGKRGSFDINGTWDNDVWARSFLLALKDNPLQFDYLIIDEAQDVLCEEFIPVFDAILKGGLKNGHFSIFGDFQNQGIYRGDSEENPVSILKEHCDFAVFNLTKNCRNSLEICEEIKLTSGVVYKSTLKGKSDINVSFKNDWNSEEEEARELEENINKLVYEGIRPQDIVILSPKTREKSCVRFFTDLKDFYPGIQDISFSTIHGFKGLESKAVIIVDVDHYLSPDGSTDLMYVGMSRAKSALIIYETDSAMLERAKLMMNYVNL